jgi:hypothetical protein
MARAPSHARLSSRPSASTPRDSSIRRPTQLVSEPPRAGAAAIKPIRLCDLQGPPGRWSDEASTTPRGVAIHWFQWPTTVARRAGWPNGGLCALGCCCALLYDMAASGPKRTFCNCRPRHGSNATVAPGRRQTVMIKLSKGGGTGLLPLPWIDHPLEPRCDAMIKTDYGLLAR